ncbi:Scr1 family TA system antitoxin-like transcriptional regulator [Nocardiopsis changdeensis]|uniref:Scr1 family TA system antitoxin-like transcriptional regulator n=1 Tax=Nocardiopsis changdeensis TaxID=2831969 RepID=UPI003F460F46
MPRSFAPSSPPRCPVSVIVETFTRELVITEPEEVGRYRDIHAVLTGHALDEAASRDHLRELAASL